MSKESLAGLWSRFILLPFTWGSLLLVALRPALSQWRDVSGILDLGLIALGGVRLVSRAPVPVEVRLMASVYVISVIPFVWTGEIRDLTRPLAVAALTFVAGSCGPEILEAKCSPSTVIVFIAVLTQIQAFGVISRYGLDVYSVSRFGWNLVGALAAIGGVSVAVVANKSIFIVLLLPSLIVTFASGSRNSTIGLCLGLFIVFIGARRQIGRSVVIVAILLVIVIVAVAVYSGADLSRVLPWERISRGFTLSDTNRSEEWSYWLGMFREHPMGMGTETTDLTEVTAYSHNGWLDIGVRGGIAAVLVYIIAQILMLIRLGRGSKNLLTVTALALITQATFRMMFEAGTITQTYGLVGYLPIYCAGLALFRESCLLREPRTMGIEGPLGGIGCR
jgi:hypothetical protein